MLCPSARSGNGLIFLTDSFDDGQQAIFRSILFSFRACWTVWTTPERVFTPQPVFNTASTLDGIIWGRFMAIGPYGVSPFLMRSLHTAYPAVDLAEKPRIGV